MIYVVSHKWFEMIDGTDREYRAIYVGEVHKYACEEGYLTDESPDESLSISGKNVSYCELTAMYYIWKNTQDEENGGYVGLDHYRRYFVKDGLPISGEYIKKTVDGQTVILPYPVTFQITVRDFFIKWSVYKKDLYHLRLVIALFHPDYLGTFDTFMEGRTMSCGNMFVMIWSNYERYCQWLFDVLEKLESVTDMRGYTDPEKRIYGYMGELLLNVWILKNNIRVQYCEVINTENENVKKRKIVNRLKSVVKGVVYFPTGIPRRRLRMDFR